MRISGRRPGQDVARGLAFVLALALPGPAQAGDVSIAGEQTERFGRIILTFERPTKVKARTANGVLVVEFDAPTRIRREKLATEIARYVTVVRRDPDESGLRLALAAPLRANVLEAGERVLIDLLPATWKGLPPGLPPAIVAELAARAQAAEAKLKRAGERPPTAQAPVTLRLAELPTLTRLVFEPSPGTPIRVSQSGAAIEATFEGATAFDGAGAKPRAAAGVAGFSAGVSAGSVLVALQAAEGYAAQSFREGDTLVVDLARPGAQAGPPSPRLEPARPTLPAVRQAAPLPETPAPVPTPAPVAAAPSAPVQRIADSGSPEPAVIRATLEGGRAGPSVLFPFRTRTPAAAFERGGRLTLLFDTRDQLDLGAVRDAGGSGVTVDEVRADAGLVVVRLTPTEPRSARLVAAGDGWRLILGGPESLPPDPVRAVQTRGERGETRLLVELREAAAAHWLPDPDSGGRLAVVTATGRPQGVPDGRAFIDFALPPTLQGVVIEPKADDVAVSLGRGGILVGRREGLQLSQSSATQGPGGAAVKGLLLSRDDWSRDVAGSPIERHRELVAETVAAARPARGGARLRLARFLLANGLDNEATGVLDLARAEDPALARGRDALLLSGIAAARAARFKDARRHLGAVELAQDPEAALWRAMTDSGERRWLPALAGLRRAEPILAQYPDDLAAAARLAALRSALEAGEFDHAESELAAIDAMPTEAGSRDAVEFGRARLDEARGRKEAALKGYERLASDGSRPVAAEAALHAVKLASASGALPRDAAIETLETLAVTWRGGETEIATIVELGRLYAQAGRWRDAFLLVRRANRHFPDHDGTRALHDEMARLFDGLLLGEASSRLSAVDSLALYYDFKELAPVGRRGDELVRRLADRLVELDLLDGAAELLQHQVDKRLTGAARSAVAARLAAIRLMTGKPLLALQVLQATRAAELPGDLKRTRLLIEARAAADLSRIDLALELLDGEEDDSFARMRVAILFGAGRWREAGEAGEAILGQAWRGTEPLGERQRGDVLRTTVAYLLAGERIGLDRLRGRFAAKMGDSPDVKTFEALFRPGAIDTREFRTIAQAAGRLDGPRDLLAGRAVSEAVPVGRAGAG